MHTCDVRLMRPIWYLHVSFDMTQSSYRGAGGPPADLESAAILQPFDHYGASDMMNFSVRTRALGHQTKRSRWETERLKRAEPGRYHWLGHNKLAALARRRQAYQQQLPIGRNRRETDKPECKEKQRKTSTFEQSASLPKSASIMGCLLSHPLNSALFTRAVSQKSVSHF